MQNRYSYVKYDEASVQKQALFRSKFEALTSLVDTLHDGRAKSLIYTKLEEAYMWVGKAVRDDQIVRQGIVDEQPERTND